MKSRIFCIILSGSYHMTIPSLIKTGLLTGVCIAVLSGCSWFEGWRGGEAGDHATRQEEVLSASAKGIGDHNTKWSVHGDIPYQSAKGFSLDDAAAHRIAALELEVENLRNELRMIMPALTKLAAAQGGLQDVMAAVGAVYPANDSGTDTKSAQLRRATVGEAIAAIDPENETDMLAIPPAHVSGRDIVVGHEGSHMAYPDQGRDYEGASVKEVMTPEDVARIEPAAAAITTPIDNLVAPSPRKEEARDVSVGNAAQTVYAPAQQQIESYNPDRFVRNIRFGEHADKTRIVLDTNADVPFSYDVDNSEYLLVIGIENTGWRGAEQMDIANSPLVSAYNVVPDGKGGHQLIMQLKQAVNILWAEALPPGGPQGHRIVIDMTPII